MTQKQFLFGQKRSSGEEKKKSKASLLVSFPNWANLGVASAVSVLETTICHSSLTRWRDRNVVAEPTLGNMLAAYPKQTCKIQLLLLQIFRWEEFPYIQFWTIFFTCWVKMSNLGAHLERLGSDLLKDGSRTKTVIAWENTGTSKTKSIPQDENGCVWRDSEWYRRYWY